MKRSTRESIVPNITAAPSMTMESDWCESFDQISAIQLSHGQCLWLLSELGFNTGTTPGTFNWYIKSLRKLGVPFKRGEVGLMAGRLAKYSFNHVMELCVGLSIRVYGILPDMVVQGLIRFRDDLYDCYRQAYLHRISDNAMLRDVAARKW